MSGKPFEYHVIEEFLLFLEKEMYEANNAARNASAIPGKIIFAARCAGEADALSRIAYIIRNSNIGIVYPPGKKPKCSCIGFQHSTDCKFWEPCL